MELTDQEILSLEKIVVKGNSKASKIIVCSGYYGMGNSNTSKAVYDRDYKYDIAELNDKPIQFITTISDSDEQVAVAGIINDTLIIIIKWLNGKLDVKHYPLGPNGYSLNHSIAYDTMGFCNILLK